MDMTSPGRPADRFLASTHEVTNVARELVDYNLYREDAALARRCGAKARHGPTMRSRASARSSAAPSTSSSARSRTGTRPSSTPTIASAIASTSSASIRRTTR